MNPKHRHTKAPPDTDEGKSRLKKEKSFFTRSQVEDYAKKRYKNLDQRIVHLREVRIIKKFLEKLPESQGKALDIPCGYGRFSQLLIPRKRPVINSDFSINMVQFTLENIPDSCPVSGVVADATQNLPFQDNSFYLLLSMRFFQHVHEKDKREKILREFGRISSGWAIISFYQANGLHSLQRKLKKRLSGNKRQVQMMSKNELVRILDKTGWEIKKASPLFRGLHSQRIMLLQKLKLEQQP